MMPRLEAEEQTARITAQRVAYGAGDEKGKRAVDAYEKILTSQRGGQAIRTTSEAEDSRKERFGKAAELGIALGRPKEMKE